jgi:hypothetical protein
LFIDAMHLKNVLGDIQPNNANLTYGGLLSCGSYETALWAHRDAGRGAIHSIDY